MEVASEDYFSDCAAKYADAAAVGVNVDSLYYLEGEVEVQVLEL